MSGEDSNSAPVPPLWTPLSSRSQRESRPDLPTPPTAFPPPPPDYVYEPPSIPPLPVPPPPPPPRGGLDEGVDSFGNLKPRRNSNRRPLQGRKRRNRRKSRTGVPPTSSTIFPPPPPPTYSYRPPPVTTPHYQGTSYSPSGPMFDQTTSYSPYPSYQPPPYDPTPPRPYEAFVPQPPYGPTMPPPPYGYSAPPPPYVPPMPSSYHSSPYSSSMYPPPGHSTSLQPPAPDANRYDPTTGFRTVEHRFAGWLFRIQTDAAPHSKKLKVKRVGDTVEYYCSGVLLTKLKYKLERDVFYLYADPNADRSASPFHDTELCSKIEILMGCIIADIFESPWDNSGPYIPWGVSGCYDIGDGNSLYVSVSKDTGSPGTGRKGDSLSAHASGAHSTAVSPYWVEQMSSGPVVSQLDAFQRVGSYDRTKDGYSRSAAQRLHTFEQSDVLAVLRKVELITAMQLGKRSHLPSSEVASVVGSKHNFFYSDHVCGRFDAKVPTLFGLLVFKLRDWGRRKSTSIYSYDYFPSRSSGSDSTEFVPFNLESKPTYNSDMAIPAPMFATGATDSMVPATPFGADVYPNDIQAEPEAEGNSNDESQASGEDPFAQQDSGDTDTDNDSNSGEDVPPLSSVDDPSRASAEVPYTSLGLLANKPYPYNESANSDNRMVTTTITGTPPLASPSGEQELVRPLDQGTLAPPLIHTHGNLADNGQRDFVTSPGQGETVNSRTGAIYMQAPYGNFQTPAIKSAPVNLRESSEQGNSVDSADRQYSPVVTGKGEDRGQADSDDVSSDEGQTQAHDSGGSLDGLTLSKKETDSVELAGSAGPAGERQDLDERYTRQLPSGEIANQGGIDEISGSEGETAGKDDVDPYNYDYDNTREPAKSILRSKGKGSRRKRTSNQLQFSVPPPAHSPQDEGEEGDVSTGEEDNEESAEARRRRRADVDERRKAWNERRRKHERITRKHERITYPTPAYASSYASPHALPSPVQMPSRIPEENVTPIPAYPSEGPAYEEAVSSGRVYERTFQTSQSQSQQEPRRSSSRRSDMENTYAVSLGTPYDNTFPTPPIQPIDSDGSSLPTPATSRRNSRSYSRLSRRNSGLTRKSSYKSSIDEDSEDSYTESSTGSMKGKNRAALHVAKELFTVILGVVIVILSALAIAFDPAQEENWFKRIEEGIFVMFSLGVPLLLAMRSRLSDNLEILLPKTTRDVRSIRDLQNMNEGMSYDDFVKQLQKAILLDEELSAMFSFKNAGYKLSRESGKLVCPMQASYSKLFKSVWFFGEELAFNRILGRAFRYRHENNVLYIEKNPVDVDGVIVHVRRRVGNYVLGSSPEN